MKFRIYIFGAPEIFDLFDGDADEISYFQTYDDGSKEDTKLTIHRRANGQVSYSYLRYNFLSGSGRIGAFFGISVVFSGEYCYDASKLFRLFDTVYKDKILQDKILIEETQGNQNIQAKFLIRTFKEQEAEVRNIENIILKNIENKFTSDILAVDSNFKQGKPNLIRKFNTNKDNAAILKALQNYSWVSISPTYPESADEISKEGIKALSDTAKEITYAIINNYKKLSDKPDVVRKNINELESTIKDIQNTIQNFLENQPELKELKDEYLKIQNQLYDQKIVLENELIKKENIDIKYFKKESQNEIDKRTDDSKRAYKSINIPFFGSLKLNHTFYKYATISLIGIIGISALLWQIFRDGSSGDKTDCPQCISYYENFKIYLSRNKFEQAWNELEKLRNENRVISSQQNSLTDKIKYVADSLMNSNKEQNLREALILLKNSIKYGNTNISQDTIDITESIRLIQAQQAFQKQPPKYNDVEKLCLAVIESNCSENIKDQAEALLNESLRRNNASSSATHKQDTAKIIIHIYEGDVDYKPGKDITAKKDFKVNMKIVVSAKQGISDASGGIWKFEESDEGIIEVNDLTRNPLNVKLKKIGKVKLTYKGQSRTLTVGW